MAVQCFFIAAEPATVELDASAQEMQRAVDPGNARRVVGSHDFKGDDKSDILPGKSTTGKLIKYQMNGAAVSAAARIGSPGIGWVAQ